MDVDGRACDKFMLTRLPMGGSHAAHIAQTVTWAILEPITQMAHVQNPTMLDNVCIASNDEHSFVKAVQCFLHRCELVGATLNDQDTIPRSREEILSRGLVGSEQPFIFLGEEYIGDRVRNPPKHIEKLRKAWQRLRNALSDHPEVITRRNLAAIIALVFWMCNTLDIGMHHLHNLLRMLSAVESASGPWDSPVAISPTMVNQFAPVVHILLENKTVRPYVFPRPSQDASDYDAVVIVDASATGFGGYALVPSRDKHGNPMNRVLRFSHGFSTHVRHSAWAEPFGAKMILQLIRKEYGAKNVAVVTDHSAMPLRQQRPLSGHGAFSPSFYLNQFFCELYTHGGGQVFFVPGERNIGDAPSRETWINQKWSIHDVTETQNFPSLAEFHHPYLRTDERRWWNV